MTYQDPDPLRPDPLRDRDLDRLNADSDLRERSSSNAMWGWIAGAVVLVLMLVFLFRGADNMNTADMRTQPNASAPTVNTPPANNIANAPRPASPPAETTGQSSQR
jgi:hypothetical protein